jgi:hypothetical protein
MTPEEAVRKIRACRDDHQCPNEQACFVLLKYVERKLAITQIEDSQESDGLQYYTAPIGI